MNKERKLRINGKEYIVNNVKQEILDYIFALEGKVKELQAVEEYYKKRTKDLEDTKKELGLAECRVKNANEIISKMQRYKINKAIKYIRQETFRYSMCFVDNETGLIDLKRSDFAIKQLSPKKVEKLLDILEGGFDK